MILLSGVYVPGGELTGTQLTQSALAEHIGWIGPYFIAVAIFFFAFTSIIGNYSYSEMAMTYLQRRHADRAAWRCGSSCCVMVVWGALQAVATVFNTADASMGLMATINLIAIVALSGTVVKLTRDYFAQRKAGGRAELPRQGLSRARRPDRPHDLDPRLIARAWPPRVAWRPWQGSRSGNTERSATFRGRRSLPARVGR